VRDPPERESVTNLLTLKRSKKINNELLVSDHPSTQNHNSQRGAPLNEINMPPKPSC
jgi:hypothetical protein